MVAIFYVLNASEIAPKMWTQLKRLTCKKSSGMRDDFIPYMLGTDTGKVVVSYNDLGKIMGWACWVPTKFRSTGSNIAIYVTLKYRKKGIGRDLISCLRENVDVDLQPQIIKRNCEFFKKVFPPTQICSIIDKRWNTKFVTISEVTEKKLGV
jgi:hypothetical protein